MNFQELQEEDNNIDFISKWIRQNRQPEEIFSTLALTLWAEKNGFISVKGKRELQESAKKGNCSEHTAEQKAETQPI